MVRRIVFKRIFEQYYSSMSASGFKHSTNSLLRIKALLRATVHAIFDFNVMVTTNKHAKNSTISQIKQPMFSWWGVRFPADSGGRTTACTRGTLRVTSHRDFFLSHDSQKILTIPKIPGTSYKSEPNT